jgi:hypothetical protein
LIATMEKREDVYKCLQNFLKGVGERIAEDE